MRRLSLIFILITSLLAAQQQLTNEDVLKMAKAGMSDDVLAAMVEKNPGKYATSPDDLIALKSAGVGDRVIAAMVNKGTVSNSGATPTKTESNSPGNGQPILLMDATPVKLRLSRNLSSADAKVGESVDFEVLEELTIDNLPVIARGSTAMATVTEAQPKRRMGRGGKLNVNIDYIRLTSGEKVALRAIKETKGGGHTGAMTGAMVATSIVFFPAAPLFLFMHGKDIVIPKGTEITAYVNGDIKLDRAKFTGGH